MESTQRNMVCDAAAVSQQISKLFHNALSGN